jgi:hypothetical protein
MDGIALGLQQKLERFLFLLARRVKGKKVEIIGHPGSDIDLVATLQFLRILCWELGAKSVELIHRIGLGEDEDLRLLQLGVVPLEIRHLADDRDTVRILADCSDLARAFGRKEGFPTIDFIVDHHIPSFELIRRRAEYLILPEFGCAALIAYLVSHIHCSVKSTIEGQVLALSAFAIDNDLHGNDFLRPSFRIPEVHPSVQEFCSRLYQDLFKRGELELFYHLVEEPWQNPQFASMLDYALDHCLEVRAPEVVALQFGSDKKTRPRDCLLGLVELPEVPTQSWIAKLAGILLKALPLQPEAVLVRGTVGGLTVTSVRTHGKLDASKVIRRFEGDGGGRITSAGFTRSREIAPRFVFPRFVSPETRIGWLAGQVIEFLRKED